MWLSHLRPLWTENVQKGCILTVSRENCHPINACNIPHKLQTSEYWAPAALGLFHCKCQLFLNWTWTWSSVILGLCRAVTLLFLDLFFKDTPLLTASFHLLHPSLPQNYLVYAFLCWPLLTIFKISLKSTNGSFKKLSVL